MVKNVIVLGCAYGGVRAAKLLYRSLPESHRLVVIDKNSHFNHLYLFPRYGVVAGHAHKAFVPGTNLFNGPDFTWPPAPSPVAKFEHVGPENAPLTVHAKAIAMTDEYIELDADVTDENSFVILTEQWKNGPKGDRTEAELREGLTLEGKAPNDPLAKRRIPWDYLVLGTGCEMPRSLLMDAREKKIGVNYLENQCQVISRAEKILVAGGGALGVQYATDIADLYNNPENAAMIPAGSVVPKKITIVSSRRFLPVYKEALHEAVQRRMDTLGIETILYDRVIMPSDEQLLEMENNTNKRTTYTIGTRDGKEIEADLVLGCTGQRPNTHILEKYSPTSLDEGMFVRVSETMQAEGLPKVFAVGDVAAAGVIKAGHTAWDMATVAVENIVTLLRGPEGQDLQKFEKTPPKIKVTLGFKHASAETTVKDGDKETQVFDLTDGTVEGHWQIIWMSIGADMSDPTI